jgi:hypothetical protein
MLNTIIALLIEKDLMTEAEGRALADKLRLATLPADFSSAAQQVKKFLDEIEKGR